MAAGSLSQHATIFWPGGAATNGSRARHVQKTSGPESYGATAGRSS